jgi:hypothetical protein
VCLFNIGAKEVVNHNCRRALRAIFTRRGVHQNKLFERL